MRDLSYRLKVPLIFGIVILLTAVVIAVGLLIRSGNDLKADIPVNAQQLSDMMASSLASFVQHDEVWEAYQLIHTPVEYIDRAHLPPRTISVIDTNGKVFVSTEPSRFPMLAEIGSLGKDYEALSSQFETNPSSKVVLEGDRLSWLIVATPLDLNDTLIGHIIFEYDTSLLAQLFIDQATDVGLITIGILALLLPIGLVFGNRVAKPLVKLAACMADVGKVTLDDMDCRLTGGDDEIGRLSEQFKTMLHGLEHTRELEKSVFASDRLAAIGRLVAGIAHEINNPLAGMLNAVNTYHKHGKHDPVAAKTIDLLERGLQQIRDTVSALIVEARVNTSPLSSQDIEDILTLVKPELRKKALRLSWQNNVDTAISLPSSPVRQVLLNLALNAINASPDGGKLDCHIENRDDALHISMLNDSDNIPIDQLEQLFEPFTSLDESGTGLGLWVTYQIVDQLGGDIRITSPGQNVFVEVNLPMQEAA